MTPASIAALTLGRLLLGGLFVLGGVTHVFVLPGMAADMARRGVPAPMLVLITGSLFESAAGAMVMLGWHVAIPAGALIVFTIVSSCMMMNFWDMAGAERLGAIDGWTSNLGVIGGLLVIAALG